MIPRHARPIPTARPGPDAARPVASRGGRVEVLTCMFVHLMFVLLLLGVSCSTPVSPKARRVPADSTRTATRSKRNARSPARPSARDTVGGKVRSAAKSAAGAVARAAGAKGKRGSLQPTVQNDRAAERKRQLDERKRLREENRRKRQEERLARRTQRTRGSRTRGHGSLYDAYTLKATISGRYALVGTRRLERGDVIAGRKIIDIQSDRIILDQAGSTISVRIGETVPSR